MQNHSPYGDYYINNEFQNDDCSIADIETCRQISNYSKGISLTDKATIEFLNELNNIDKPITIIFYGDHLPSIYSTTKAKIDALTLHETDYFIWSNDASETSKHKLDTDETPYSSSNYLMATAATHMNAAVSPYLAFLTELQHLIPAISRLGGNIPTLGEGDTIYLDMNGIVVNTRTLSSEAQQYFEDYLLIQYDLTAGNGYLFNTDFFTVPESSHIALTRDRTPEASHQ